MLVECMNQWMDGINATDMAEEEEQEVLPPNKDLICAILQFISQLIFF